MSTEAELQSQFDKIRKREITARRLSIVIAIIPFLFGCIWLYYTYTQVQKLKVEKEKTQHEIQASQQQLDSIQAVYTQFSKALQNVSTDSLSNPATRQQVLTASIRANNELQTISNDYTVDTNVVIRYYFKSVDDQKLLQSLKGLGYKFREQTPKTTMSATTTNAIWYGSRVSLTDCKLVALTLVRAGVKIKTIRPFRANTSDAGYKANIIEIGGDALLNYSDKKPLTVDDIASAATFYRN